jgi:Tfp pilus assembly protein PilN
MALGRQHMTMARGHNSVSFRTKDKRLGPVSNTIVLIVLACLLGLLYLTQVTKTNAYGYTIHHLEQEQAALQTEQDDLRVASARLQSVERLENSAETAAMVPVAPSDTAR